MFELSGSEVVALHLVLEMAIKATSRDNCNRYLLRMKSGVRVTTDLDIRLRTATALTYINISVTSYRPKTIPNRPLIDLLLYEPAYLYLLYPPAPSSNHPHCLPSHPTKWPSPLSSSSLRHPLRLSAPTLAMPLSQSPSWRS